MVPARLRTEIAVVSSFRPLSDRKEEFFGSIGTDLTTTPPRN
jgi:hypothetical protein